MSKQKLRTIILVLGAIVLLVLILVFVSIRQPKVGTLQVVLNLPDTHDLQLDVNGDTKKVTSLRPFYKLPKGDYHLAVSKPGYSNFTADFTITINHETTVNVTMQRISPAPTAGLPDKLIPNLEVNGVTVAQATYFYDNSWAFVEIATPDGNNGFIIARYDDKQSRWQSVLGPGTRFEESSLTGIPADVVQYMRQNNFVSGGLDVQ